MSEPLPLDVSAENYATVALQDDASATATATSAAVAGPVSGKTTAHTEDADVDEDDQAAVSQKRERRTELTDEEFLAQKEGYEAKVEGGDIWKELLAWTPPFTPSSGFLSGASTFDTATWESSEASNGDEEGSEKQKLDKKQHQTLQAAIAELYWRGNFDEVVEIVRWARRYYSKDGKFEVQLGKWEGKALARLEKAG